MEAPRHDHDYDGKPVVKTYFKLTKGMVVAALGLLWRRKKKKCKKTESGMH